MVEVYFLCQTIKQLEGAKMSQNCLKSLFMQSLQSLKARLSGVKFEIEI